ncbi:hypothetical protein [Bacillus sp. OTU2372]
MIHTFAFGNLLPQIKATVMVTMEPMNEKKEYQTLYLLVSDILIITFHY